MGATETHIFTIVVAGTALVLFLGGCIVAFVVLYKKRQAGFRAEKLQLQHHFEEAILRSQLEVGEQTLRHVSQEIHDNIGQTLSLAKLTLHTANGAGSAEKVETAKTLVAKAITDLRQLSRSLHPESVLTGGLIKAIAGDVQLLQGAGKAATLTVSGTPVPIDPQKEWILYRTVQEAVQNCLKHAAATAVTVQMLFDDDRLRIAIADDGGGFDPLAATAGAGLRHMRQRATLIGGTLAIDSGAAGTTITITLPTPLL